jgi:hypothetical protein
VHCQNANQPKESGLHFARSAASRKISELGVRGVFASLFDQGASFPKSDSPRRARTPKVPRLRDETQRTKFAQARHGEFVLWRTAKTFIDSANYRRAAASLFRPSSSSTIRLMCL